MRKGITVLAIAAASLLLTACRAEVTERVALQADGRAIATITEVLDDDVYGVLRQRDSGGTLFPIDRFESSAWETTRKVDGDGRHVLIAVKHCDADAVETCLSRLPFVSAAHLELRRAVRGNDGRFDIVGNLLRIDLRVGPYGLPEIAGQPDLVARIVDATASLILRVRVQVSAPGDLVATNGERLSDGAVQWDVDLRRSKMAFVQYRVVDRERVFLAVAVVLGAIAVVGLLLALKRLR